MTIAYGTIKATVTAALAAAAIVASVTAATADGSRVIAPASPAPAPVAAGCKVWPCPGSIPSGFGKPHRLAVPGETLHTGGAHDVEQARWPRWRNGCRHGGWGSVKCPKF